MTAAYTPIRRLPLSVPPVAAETIASYLRRLAAVNHVYMDEIDDVLHIRKQSGRRHRLLDIAKLSSLTGYDPDRLRRALPELRTATQLRLVPLRTGPACPHCVLRHSGGAW